VRRILTGVTAFLVISGLLAPLPARAAPATQLSPVRTSTSVIPMGSVTAPAPGAQVQAEASGEVAGMTGAPPSLSVRRTGTEEFSLLGVTWAHDPAVTDTVVRIRAMSVTGAWGEWSEVETQDPGPNATATPGARLRGGTEPLWTGPSTGVQAEVLTRSGAHPSDVRLDLVDPGSSATDVVVAAPALQGGAASSLAAPAVHSRAEWGADEGIRTWEPQYAPTLEAATLHHTTGTSDYTAAQVPAMIRAIYRYHAVSRGWGDIGYHVIVDRFGQLWEGRYGGLASTVIGAHAGGFNAGTFGVAMLGDYDLVDPTGPMVDAIAAFIAWKFAAFGIEPDASTTLTSSGGGTSRYATGVEVTLPTVFAHRDVGSTECPGDQGYARLGEIRDKVAQRLASARSLSG
jgi:uncharacterized protein with LGFP repeats